MKDNGCILIGLGNLGQKYQSTRHNAGHMLVDYLAQHPIEGLKTVKTNCFMNNSGSWLKSFLTSQARPHGPAWLGIAHDDLDLKLGTFKIQFAKGPRDHQGIASIEAALGTKDFWRVRLGIDHRQGRNIPGEEYVLKPFTRSEKKILQSIMPNIKIQISNQIQNPNDKTT